MREQFLAGRNCLAAVTELLQRVRRMHPTHGLYEAAEIQWWWHVPRHTDTLDQLFWFDELDRPVAAVTFTDFGDGSSSVYEAPTAAVIVLPDAQPEWVAGVVERGFSHARILGFETIELEVDRLDQVMRDLLLGHGFTAKEDGLIEMWLQTDARPEVSAIPEGYRLLQRSNAMEYPHPMTDPRRPGVEQRLRQASLYRSDLDLFILDTDDQLAANGLFWYDPETSTGVVEPMRTLKGHRGRGLSRHLLTAGIDLLAGAGAERIKTCCEPDEVGIEDLHPSVGFEPHGQTDVFSGTISEVAT